MKKRGLKINSNKGAQVTLFVIIAIVIVAAIAFVFVSMNQKPLPYGVDGLKDPRGYVQMCALEALRDAEAMVMPTGGFLMPQSYLLYNETKVTWMCYTPFNEQSTSRYPMLNVEIEKQIHTYVLPKVEKCFLGLKDIYRNYPYEEKELTIKPEILDGTLSLEIRREVSIDVKDQIINIDNFDIKMLSPLYDFVMLEHKIVNDEVSCDCMEETCNADVIELSRDNHDYEIRRFVSGKNEKVYTLEEVSSGKIFNFAVRNCVRLP